MELVPLSATDDDLLVIVRSWLEVLAAKDYERVFSELGYAMAYGADAAAIRRDIEKYRSAEFYPGISEFHVTDWRTARGGNPSPLALIRRYKLSERLPIVATIEVDLPLNGRWSDLEADFVVTAENASDSVGILSLEDISSPSRSEDDV
ncbi:MAG: hypothetical protein ACRD5H_13080 [Nitrososphaerales archaeon]